MKYNNNIAKTTKQKVSHNLYYVYLENCIIRQERLLKRWKAYFGNGSIEIFDNELLKLLADTQKELSYPLFRKKMKGGKNA